MRRVIIHCIGIISSAVVFGLLFRTATSAKESSVQQLPGQRRQLVDMLRCIPQDIAALAGEQLCDNGTGWTLRVQAQPRPSDTSS